jgi:hypothetical protein
MRDDEKSIEELCRPLSAKVLPQRALYSISGREMTPAKAQEAARRTGHNNRKAKAQK